MGTDEQPLSDNSQLIWCGETYSANSSRRSTKFCVKEMEEKSVSKLKAKEKANFSKFIGGKVTFLLIVTFLLLKLMFAHSASCLSRSHGVLESKTRDYPLKPNVRVASRIAKLPQQFRTYDLRKWVLLGCFKRLFTWVFVDLIILELVDHPHERVKPFTEILVKVCWLTNKFQIVRFQLKNQS